MKNPFTGEILYAPIDDPIDMDARDNLIGLLKKFGATREEENTYIYMKVSDENQLRMEIQDFFEGCSPVAIAFEYDTLNIELASTLLEICRVANFVVRSGIDSEPAAIVSVLENKKLLERWPKLQKIQDPETFLKWMKDNLE